MFEEEVKEISKKLGGKEKEYFILTHKKHVREIYFQNNKRAINFMKIKFNSMFKGIIYLLIKIGLLQIFLRKIKLSSNIGEVIFVANSIKGFDLRKGIVLSFIKNKLDRKDFIYLTDFKKKRFEEGYSPKIFEVDKEFPFSKEEMLPEYSGGDDIEVFEKLYSWYKLKGIKEIPIKKHVDFLIKKLDEKEIKNKFIYNFLNKVRSFGKNLVVSELHGAFCKEQILIRKNSYVFVDWSKDEGFEKDLIIRDLITFFRDETDFLENKKFQDILKIYPKVVKEDIHLYLILNEISSIARRGISEIPLRRIKKILERKSLKEIINQ